MSLIHLSMALVLFSVLSTFLTIACFCVDLLEMALSCKSSTDGSLCFAAGSSRIWRPSCSLDPSGLGTLINASISPTAGMKSGIKGLNLVSNSIA